jgi:hypothetical protein
LLTNLPKKCLLLNLNQKVLHLFILAKTPQLRYEPEVGFNFYFDMVDLLPRKFRTLQVVFGGYNGDKRAIDPKTIRL